MAKRLPSRSDQQRENATREVVQSYIVTRAMYDFNVYEKRVLYNLVKLAQSQIEGVRLAENLYRIDHMYRDFIKVELPISDFLVDSDDKHHMRIKEALQSLHRKTFTYRDSKVWECLSIIANPKIELRSSQVSFIINSKVWDVLLDFSKGFSRYDIDVAFSLESPYSMRFYELLCGQSSPITYSIEDLKAEFQLEGKYQYTKDFIRRVVDSAKNELDRKAPVSFTYRPLKDGRKYTRITFYPNRFPEREKPDTLFRTAVRKYGSGLSLTRDEYRTLREIGFTDNGINNNLSLFLESKKRLDFPLELSLIAGKSRTKKNPCGWCVRALRGILSDKGEL